ncbi:MAG: hypothetical protein O3A63_02390 [Proteobacteria bacterium]|nr:hypothetical protein [Pseudomonadota bacterium]
MKIVLGVALIASALTEFLAAAALIGGPAGIQAAGMGELWSMHYGFAVLAIASISIWIWPHRYDRKTVTPALLTLMVFHIGLCLSLMLAGDQAVGMIIHGILALLFITLLVKRASFTAQ